MKISEQLEADMKDNDFGKKQNSGDLFFQFKEGENRVRILTEGVPLGQHYFGKGVKPSTCYGVSKGCPFHEENYLGDDVLTDDEKKKKFPNVSVKYTVYLLDCADGTIRQADLPWSVLKKVGEFQDDADYLFDEFPMPYDIKVTYKSTAAPADMYKVIASPKREEISAETSNELNEKMEKYPIADGIAKKKTDSMEAHKEQGIWISPEMYKESFDKNTARINSGKEKMPVVSLDEVEEEVDKMYPKNDLGEPGF